MKLSVGIITFNEERKLGKVLESVKDIADEIIIIDSGSTDKTEEIARKYTDKFYYNPWPGFGPQKNLAISKCSGEWILLLDADEELSYPLVEKIKYIINNEAAKKVFEIKRISICFEKIIKYGGWSNEYRVRLWKNGTVRINERLVHENYETKEKIYRINEKINHYVYENLQHCIEKYNNYSTLGAKEYYSKGKKTSIFKVVGNSSFSFLKVYLFRFGFLDGIEGLVMAWTFSFYTMSKYFKLREIYRNDSYK